MSYPTHFLPFSNDTFAVVPDPMKGSSTRSFSLDVARIKGLINFSGNVAPSPTIGDIFPITSLGKLLGSISAIFGIGFFALPAGLLATGFSEEIKKEKSFCPHCGEKLPSD